MSIPLEASIVRIFASDGDIVGTGFLVGEMTVLTCTHVVAIALGFAADEPIAPEQAIKLDFPLVASGYQLSARVIFWQPIQADKSGDIALLQVGHAPPEGANAARLVIAEDLWEHPFRAFGFPDHHDQGVWVSGKLRAREATGWIQIEDVKTTGKGVQRGFSGGAVWDEQLEGVAGMIVAADEDASKVAYMIPSKVLVQVVPALRQQAIPPCPYRGLFAFREQDTAYFFGREGFTQQVVDALRTKPLVTLVGPSGSGKSSIVFAGLLPRLHHEGNWLTVSCRPGTHPSRSLAAALIPLLEPEMSETDRLVEIKKLADRLEQGTISLHDVVNRLQQLSSATHLLLVIDQFEELYTLCQWREERQHFLETMLAAIPTNSRQASCDFHLLLTLRADFLGHALAYRPLADALQHADVKLGPMMRQELQEAIQHPAQKLHVQLEDGLTERLLDGVGSAPGNLPLLEFALSLLWTRQQAGTLTHSAYDEIGGVEQALARYAEEVYETLEEKEQKQAQHIFTQLIQPGEGTEDIRRLATRTEIGEERWSVVVRLSDARLVVTGRNEATGQETVEVIHEALIREWERLHGWIEASREFRLWQERLRTEIREWNKRDREKEVLLRGTPLGEAERWLVQYPEALSEEEKAFINASIAERQQQEAAERDRQAREARELVMKRKTVIRLRFAVFALLLFLTAAVVLASMVGVLLGQTSQELQVAQSRALAANANYYLLKNQNDLALLLSARAYLTDNNYETRDALLNALDHSSHLATVLRSSVHFVNNYQTLSGLAFSPDSQTLISTDYPIPPAPLGDGVSDNPQYSGTGGFTYKLVGDLNFGGRYGGVTLWDMKTNQPHNLLFATLKSGGSIGSLAVSPTGQVFATSSPYGGIWLWDSKSGTPLVQLQDEHDGSYYTLAFSSDGKLLAGEKCYKYASGGCSQGQIFLWDRATSKLISSSIIKVAGYISQTAISPDGRLLAASICNKDCKEAQILLFSLTTGKPLGPPLSVSSSFLVGPRLQFSPDGKILAVGNDDSTITVWDVISRKPLGQPFFGHTGAITSMLFNASGTILASGSEDQTIRLWDVAKGAAIGDPLTGHQGSVERIAWSSDGLLASGDSSGSIILWNPNMRNPVTHLLQDTNLGNPTFSPDGKFLATESGKGTIILRDGKTMSYIDMLSIPPSTLLQKDIAITSLAFNPSGRILAAGISNGTVILWDVTKKSIITELVYSSTSKGKPIYIDKLSFSANGRFLVGDGEKGIILWSLATGKVIQHLYSEYPGKFVLSPDSRTLAVLGDYKINGTDISRAVTLWDAVTGRLIYQPRVNLQNDYYNDISFSPDGRTLAIISISGTITLLDTRTEQLIGQYEISDGFGFHESITYSPDGNMLAVVGDDDIGEPNPLNYAISLWNVRTHEVLAHPFHYFGYIDNVTFSPDGQQLVFVAEKLGNPSYLSSYPWGLVVLDINPGTWLIRACNVANRNFTTDEWSRFVGDKTYHKICWALPVDESVIEDKLMQAQSAARTGDSGKASSDYSQAAQWATETSNPILNRYICWFGGIDQFAKEVLPACERAVELEPDNGIYRDSRGLVRALLGNYQAAIADFNFFVQWTTAYQLYTGKPYLGERNAWIHELEIGNNPFDRKTLEEIRNE